MVAHLSSVTGGSPSKSDAVCGSNPLLQDWAKTEPFGMPPFNKIKSEHFKPAFEATMQAHLQDLASIVENAEAPSFENVCAAFDRSGSELDKVSMVFSNLCSSLNTEDLQKVQVEMAPLIAGHTSKIYTFPGLFEKLDRVKSSGMDGLTPEQCQLVERLHLDFVREGARFSEEDKKKYAEITAKLATLCTEFQQNVLADESSYTIPLQRSDLDGCPEELVDAAQEAAKAAGKEGYVMTLSRSLVEPFLTFAEKREMREKAWRAWTRRGELDAGRDNKRIAEEILKLRQQQAGMHGHATYSHYACDDMMAKTPERVMELLTQVWDKAKVSANKEREALEEYVKSMEPEKSDVSIEPWDWRYYAEKVRQAKYDFDESELKPYLSLEAVTAAAFEVSSKLFGLKYVERPDIQTYHPDVKTYEVREASADGGDDKLVAIFIHDNMARPFKASGAWMSEYRGQKKNLGAGEDPVNSLPIISNNNNFAKGQPTLLSFDDATTLFHEFGHAHHGMLSDVTFRRLAGTNVLTDFVELPSQLMEHWLKQPEVLSRLKHHETGEALPQKLLDQLNAAQLFNEGFNTIEYTACALLDQTMHMQQDYSAFDLSEWETSELARLDMPRGIIMRHRPTHFQHLFTSSQYAAGYYVYLWAEVLDADAFDAFKEAGDVFDPEVARRARAHIYAAGSSQAPDQLFRLFRGRDPVIEPMLKKKGLAV